MQDALVVAGVLSVRLILPLFIARYPIPAILGCLVVDAGDQTVFQRYTSLDLAEHQTYDKALDVYYLTLAYVSTIRNWAGGPDFTVARWLWYYRLVGVAIFEYTSAGWVLLVFPNTFEYYFIATELYKVNRDPNLLSVRQTCVTAAVIWVVIKLPQEWWVHVARLDLTDVVKEHLFGGANGTGWWSAITGRPLVAIALVVAALALAGCLASLPRWLSPAAWNATFDADRQAEFMGWRAPRKLARPRAFFGWAFAEKVVLVSLVSIIFARILPGANTRLVTMVLVTSYVIAVNTVLSQWLARRGTSWRNTTIQFVWMAIANLVVLSATAVFVGAGDGTIPSSTTLFLVGLLTLIVVLYDRSHAVFADQQGERLGDGFGAARSARVST